MQRHAFNQGWPDKSNVKDASDARINGLVAAASID
jgi:hypothetical protein